ncbi:hypothetical protein ACH5RR_004405 [Cinchona calisaya]|uniref:Plasma membrane fusion protein PRM1 n=1 Tax=Cinchona calisaya TaxID=153742 RepID=A0ABD3AXK1_9GENT
MNCLKSNPFLIFLLPLSFLLLANFFSSSYGASLDHNNLQQANIPEYLDRKIHHYHGINVEGHTRRIAEETTGDNITYDLILAADRTHRRDPTDHFNYYTGGWRIGNRHYLASVAFSAAGPIVFAIIWFVVFAVFLLCLCCRCCCCSRKSYGYSPTAYTISVVCLAVCTIAAIAGIAFVYMGQGKFESSIVNTSSFVLHKADDVIVNLKDILDNLNAAKNTSIGQSVLPDNLKAQINGITGTIEGVTTNFRNVTQKNSHDIENFLNPMKILLIGVAAALLVLSVLGFLFSVLGLGCLLGSNWMDSYNTNNYNEWRLSPCEQVRLISNPALFASFIGDTCIAMDEWLQNPNARSALEEIIPKVDNKTAQEISSVTKGVSLGTVDMINGIITKVINANVPPNVGPPLYYNQNGPMLPILCNPYDSKLADRQCAAGEVWKKYVCQVSGAICKTPGRLTPNMYNQLSTTANVSYTLYKEMPFVLDLIDSTYLKELFGDISKNYCPSLSVSTEWMYTGFIFSSVAVMFSLIIWIFYSRERRQRSYTKKVDKESSIENPFAYSQND